MLKYVAFHSFWILLFIITTIPGNGQITFDYNSEYKLLKGSDATTLSSDWMQPGFDDSAWNTGFSPFWYGDGSGGTELTDMQGAYSTIYLRAEFTAENTELLHDIDYYIDYDDGFVIWINGVRALAQNAPTTISNNSYALVNHESGTPVRIVSDATALNLNDSINTLAVQVFNVTLSSSDLHFNLKMEARPQYPEPDPSIGDVLFSKPSGFYNEPFQLTLSSPDSLATLIYTMDGSNPQSSTTAITGGPEIILDINPDNAEGRPLTPAVIVRASFLKEGFAPSLSRTRTYLFTDHILQQGYPGDPWPANDISGQRIDLGMDPDVINDERYAFKMKDALMDIPSISLVTDNYNMFDPSYGIYVNAEGRGAEWERDCSLELIYPGEEEGFQVNAGVRIRGGASRGGWNPKHSFRLFFRSKYGDAKLRYPLFGDEGVDIFDKVDFRTAQNYSWSKDTPPASERCTFVKDIFSRKLQGLMGQPYTKSRYYHLYLNGIYWGLFMTEERPEARFAESYFGDDKDDYDVVKVTSHVWPYYNEATDGNMQAWNELYALSEQGFQSNSSYFHLEGRDAEGNPVRGTKVLVDIDNLIDYMATIFYTGNFDGPSSAWYGETMPNNFYTIYNRKNKGKGFIFIGRDYEHSMLPDPLYVGEGLHENRVTIPEMDVAGPLQFHPQWLHHKLTANAEYRLRFADRTTRLFTNNGLLTPEKAENLFRSFAVQIEDAIIAESARWGDTHAHPPKTKDDDWIPELEDLYERYFPYRTDIVINQLKQAKLFSVPSPPLCYKDENILSDEINYFSGSVDLQISNPNSSGEICYTLNGEDPRKPGGAKSSSCISSEQDLSLNITGTTIILARVKKDNEWSSLLKTVLANNREDYTGLKVTELHYHPVDSINGTDTISGKGYEFIELKNTGEYAIDLSGVKIDSAVFFQFPENTFLPPGDFSVIASKPEYFYDIHGMNPSGNYAKNLSNAGEYVLITDPEGNEILSFTYSDDYPWPRLADGSGHSMVSADINPTGDPKEPDYWRDSHYLHGSPFANDLLTQTPEETADADFFKVYPNPATSFLVVENGSDQEINLAIYDISGKRVYAGKFNTSQIIIQTSEIGDNGIYFLKISNNINTNTQKIIIL
jgi:hypothetical protein